MVSSNMIHNFPITKSDITSADKIFGSDVASLAKRGKKSETFHSPS
jgi:hypothetical protein